ncbi:MAG: hypothetical protein AAGE65_13465 [Planctomycetota bacterium]
MITRIALFFLHRALDERRAVPASVRLLGEAHPPTARAVAEILEAHGALNDDIALRRELGDASPTRPGAPAAAAWSRTDPAWWAGGGMRSVASAAAVLAVAGLVAVSTLRSGPPEAGNAVAWNLSPEPDADISDGADDGNEAPTGVAVDALVLDLPALPGVPNPLAGPSRAVRAALTPVADPAAALRKGVNRLGEGLEAPLRREWSAIVSQLDAVVRLTSPAEPEGTPAEPPAVPSTRRRPPSPEPSAAVRV